MVVHEGRMAHTVPGGTRLIQGIPPPAVRHEDPGCTCDSRQAFTHLRVRVEEAVTVIEVAVAEKLLAALY
jgi:hypothetical protein